jgi:hypothetical protein
MNRPWDRPQFNVIENENIHHSHLHAASALRFIFAAALAFTFSFSLTRTDETCSSPYLARIEGQAEFVYVWTLGVEGLGDGSDKLVTIDVKPGSPTLRKNGEQPFSRGPQRSAPRRIHRRPAPTRVGGSR